MTDADESNNPDKPLEGQAASDPCAEAGNRHPLDINPSSVHIPEGSEQPALLKKGEHNISRRGIDQDVFKIINRLYRHGFIAYITGGAVRDMLLGRTPKDFDIVTDARPGQIRKRFSNAFLIGRRFRLAHVHFAGGKVIEVATFRGVAAPERTFETERPPVEERAAEHQSAGQDLSEPLPAPEEHQDPGPEVWMRRDHGHDIIYGTPREDAFRRDITVNALFFDVMTSTIIDYVGGLEDISRRRIRVIGDPALRFTEDPVRIWRVLRHAARLGFEIDEATAQAIPPHLPLLAVCPGARLYEELNRDLSHETRPVFESLAQHGILKHILGKIGEAYEADPAKVFRAQSLLEVKDQATAARIEFAPEEKYALLLWPWVEPIFSGPQPEIHDALFKAFETAGSQAALPRSLRANIIQILFIAGHMVMALRSGRMRWSLKKRAHFGQASRLCFMIEKGRPPEQGEDFESLFQQMFPSKQALHRRRHRRWRPGPARS